MSDDSLAQAHPCVVSGDRDMKGVDDQQISKHKPLQGVGKHRVTGLCRPACRWVRTNKKRGKKPRSHSEQVPGMEKALKEKGLGLENCKQRESLPVCLYKVWLQWGSILGNECHGSQHQCLKAVSLQGAGDRNCLWGGMAAAGNEKGHPPACSLSLQSWFLPRHYCVLLHRGSTERLCFFIFSFMM